MTQHVEIEFKLALPDGEARERLLSIVTAEGSAAPAPVLQENHFFDTSERRLGSHEHALRLRIEGERHELALKGPSRAPPGSALSERVEEEHLLDADEARAILAGALSPLACALRRGSELAGTFAALSADRPVLHLGSFHNERLRLAWRPPSSAGPWSLELDRTRFPGGRVDHELEAEFQDPSSAPELERDLRDLLERAAIPWSAARSKAVRFFLLLDCKRQD